MAEQIDYSSLKKGGFMRQKQKGYFSLRLAVVGGNLTAENIKTIAEVAEKYGNGTIFVTNRQGVELPGIALEDMDAVNKARPSAVKGAFIKSAVIASTMGPGVRLNVSKLVNG